MCFAQDFDWNSSQDVELDVSLIPGVPLPCLFQSHHGNCRFRLALCRDAVDNTVSTFNLLPVACTSDVKHVIRLWVTVHIQLSVQSK